MSWWSHLLLKKGTDSIRHLGGERNRIWRRENWSGKGGRNRGENVGRGEKMECCGSREISRKKVILWLFFNLRDHMGWGIWLTLRSPWVSWDSLGRTTNNQENMESNLTHLTLTGLKIGAGPHTTHARKGSYLTFRASLWLKDLQGIFPCDIILGR